MSKKTLLIGLLSLGLLASCGGGEAPAESAASAAKSTATSTAHKHKYVEDPAQAVAATCTTKGKKVSVCECGDKKETETALADHAYVEDKTKSAAATCAADGKKVEKCSVCGKENETVIKSEGHVWTAGTKAGVMTPETCANGHNAYRFDVADATGWNNATTKMNGKPTAEGPSANSQSLWTIDATALPAGNYDIYIIGHMSYSSHSSRTWANQWENDNAETPDKETESPFRYWIEVGETVYNPTATATWGDLGYDASEDHPGLNAENVTIAAGQTEVKLEHGNIGYSMIISAVRFVKK